MRRYLCGSCSKPKIRIMPSNWVLPHFVGDPPQPFLVVRLHRSEEYWSSNAAGLLDMLPGRAQCPAKFMPYNLRIVNSFYPWFC